MSQNHLILSTLSWRRKEKNIPTQFKHCRQEANFTEEVLDLFMAGEVCFHFLNETLSIFDLYIISFRCFLFSLSR